MFHFVANLKPYLLDPGPGINPFEVYLCSADYARESRDLLAAARDDGRALVADNGNFDLIGDLIERFRPLVAELHPERQAEERALGRDVHPGEISRELRDRFQEVADEVERAGQEATPESHVRAALQAQSQIPATYLVGMEDLTIAVLSGLGITREHLDQSVDWFEHLSRRAVEFATKTREGLFGAPAGEVFAGLHGIDFDTAAQAGRVAAEGGVDGVACGLGGALSDRSYVGFRVQDGALIEFERRVPRPYVRVIEVAAGLHLGFARASGRRPRFHALGVGTPILIPLLAVLGDRDTYTATDSTAPILDAWSSMTISLYVDEPAALKLKTYRVAQVHLEGGPGWACDCPACTGINQAHPPRWDEARTWWEGEGSRSLGPADMRSPSPLADMLPLLSSPSDTDLRRATGLARVAHNHWIVRRLEAAAQDAAARGALREWTADQVERYAASSADPAWKEATRVAWRAADDAADELVEAAPGGELI